MNLKDTARSILNMLHLDLTKNLEYDRLTKEVMKKYLKTESNCIDIGCHKGEILELILKFSPKGKHMAFEPIPSLFGGIAQKFGKKVEVYPYALSDREGRTQFNFVKNAPAYSGLKKRKYAVKDPDIEIIDVELKELDDLVPLGRKIDLIKIDVEGAELSVLKGAKKTLKENKPLVIFEFGLGASDYYGTSPEDVYTLLVNECGLRIFTLSDWLKGSSALNLEAFDTFFKENTEYYFVAV